MNQEKRTILTVNTPISAPPAEPLACRVAQAYRELCAEEGLDPRGIPKDFARRIFTEHCGISEEIWQHYAGMLRPESAKKVYRFYTLIWKGHIQKQPSLMVGHEDIVLPPWMSGLNALRAGIESLHSLCLRNLGLDNCRSTDFRGRILYPEVEQVHLRMEQETIHIHGLYNFDNLQRWVGRLDELYGPYPEAIAQDLQSVKSRQLLTLRVYDLNPGFGGN